MLSDIPRPVGLQAQRVPGRRMCLKISMGPIQEPPLLSEGKARWGRVIKRPWPRRVVSVAASRPTRLARRRTHAGSGAAMRVGAARRTRSRCGSASRTAAWIARRVRCRALLPRGDDRPHHPVRLRDDPERHRRAALDRSKSCSDPASGVEERVARSGLRATS